MSGGGDGHATNDEYHYMVRTKRAHVGTSWSVSCRSAGCRPGIGRYRIGVAVPVGAIDSGYTSST
jgi:hypothetical protein